MSKFILAIMINMNYIVLNFLLNMDTVKSQAFSFQFDKDGMIMKGKLIAYVKDLFITGHKKQGTEIISNCFDEGN